MILAVSFEVSGAPKFALSGMVTSLEVVEVDQVVEDPSFEGPPVRLEVNMYPRAIFVLDRDQGPPDGIRVHLAVGLEAENLLLGALYTERLEFVGPEPFQLGLETDTVVTEAATEVLDGLAFDGNGELPASDGVIPRRESRPLDNEIPRRPGKKKGILLPGIDA